jgi:AraC-like DNA-binding protein
MTNSLTLHDIGDQLSRRSAYIHIPRHNAEFTEDREIWQSVVWGFQLHIPTVEEPNFLSNWEYLYERSLGCVGILKNWFMNAPPLDALVKISHCLGISLVDFLTQEVDIIKTSKKLLLPSPVQQKKIRASPRSFDSTQVQQALSSILAESQQPPPTLKEVAESLGYNRMLLYRHFPDLCYAIAAKSRQYLHACRLEAVAQSCEEVRQATLNLHSQGEYPTEARVSQLISKPGYFRYKKVRAALSEARHELGLET